MPAGWWHCCLNLEPSIALTQNYAPPSGARRILRYLEAGEDAGELVSGLPDELRPFLASEFAKVLKERCPEALREDEEEKQPTAKGKAEEAVPPPPKVVERDAHADFRFAF